MEANQHNITTLLSQQTREFADKLLPVTIFVVTETVIAFFANAFVFYVFIKQRSSSNNYRTFILFLTFTDFISAVTTMPGEVLGQRYWYNYPSEVICKTKDFFNVFTVSAQTICLFLITLERYIFVCSESLLHGKLALRLCCCSYIVAVVLAIPLPIFWGTRSYTKKYNDTNLNVTICEKDGQYATTYWPAGYMITVGGLVTFVLIGSMYMYAKIVAHVWKYKTDLKELYQEVKMFGVVHAVFILTTLMYFALIILLGNPNNIVQSWSENETVVFFLFLRLYFIQHVINPFIYGLSDFQIRYYLRTYFCFSFGRKQYTDI